jgi:hypothetical protein
MHTAHPVSHSGVACCIVCQLRKCRLLQISNANYNGVRRKRAAVMQLQNVNALYSGSNIEIICKLQVRCILALWVRSTMSGLPARPPIIFFIWHDTFLFTFSSVLLHAQKEKSSFRSFGDIVPLIMLSDLIGELAGKRAYLHLAQSIPGTDN